jgi:hypothetical protein
MSPNARACQAAGPPRRLRLTRSSDRFPPSLPRRRPGILRSPGSRPRPNPHRCRRKENGHPRFWRTRSDGVRPVRVLLTCTANEGILPLEIVSNSQAYDSRFREKVQRGAGGYRADLDASEVEAHFPQRPAAALREAAEHEWCCAVSSLTPCRPGAARRDRS